MDILQIKVPCACQKKQVVGFPFSHDQYKINSFLVNSFCGFSHLIKMSYKFDALILNWIFVIDLLVG